MVKEDFTGGGGGGCCYHHHFPFGKKLSTDSLAPSQWSPRFISKSVDVIFMLDRVAGGTVFSKYFGVSVPNDVEIELYRTVTLSVVLCG